MNKYKNLPMTIKYLIQTIKDWCWFKFVINSDEFHYKVKTFNDRQRAHRCDEKWR